MRECIIVLGMCLVCVTFVASLEWAATWTRYPWATPEEVGRLITLENPRRFSEAGAGCRGGRQAWSNWVTSADNVFSCEVRLGRQPVCHSRKPAPPCSGD